MGDHAQGLRIVIEAPELGEHGVERQLAGMAEGAVPQVVGQRHGLRKVLVEPQRARGGPGNLCDLQRMGEPGAEVIALVIDEHLGLVLEPPKRGAVHDPVAIALERTAQPAGGLGMYAGRDCSRAGRHSWPAGTRGSVPADWRDPLSQGGCLTRRSLCLHLGEGGMGVPVVQK